MKRKQAYLLLFLCLIFVLITNFAQTMYYAPQTDNDSETVPHFESDASQFIVFTDPHIGGEDIFTDPNLLTDPNIGSEYTSDGRNAIGRLIALLRDADRYGNQTKLCLGDLTNYGGYSQYEAYSYVTRGEHVISIKGNHDQNSAMFLEQIGKMNWAYRYGDIMFVGVGVVANTSEEWLYGGVLYDSSTYDFLESTVKSLDYNQTRYHFLFTHLAVDSTWPLDESHGVPTKFSTFVKYFDVLFSGHEGGGSWYDLWNDRIPYVKAAHLGDGTNNTDEYLAINLMRSTDQIEIYRRNFVTNQTSLLVTLTL